MYQAIASRPPRPFAPSILAADFPGSGEGKVRASRCSRAGLDATRREWKVISFPRFSYGPDVIKGDLGPHTQKKRSSTAH